ncbi:MAG TPA: hypothetical protein VFC16_09850 [Nakamurella sp.]|nr:hypothetical protein [Nakamurella sp.]
MTTTTVSAPTGCGGLQRSRPRGSGSIADQIKDQRRGYARAVLRALARTYQGRPTAQVQRVLKDAFKPLGVYLSAAALRDLATRISAGEPVTLP